MIYDRSVLEIKRCQTQDQQGEISSDVASDERLAQKGPTLATQDDLEQSASSPERVLELLLRDCQREADLGLSSSRDVSRAPMVEPPESTPQLYVGKVPEALERRLEDPAPPRG